MFFYFSKVELIIIQCRLVKEKCKPVRIQRVKVEIQPIPKGLNLNNPGWNPVEKEIERKRNPERVQQIKNMSKRIIYQIVPSFQHIKNPCSMMLNPFRVPGERYHLHPQVSPAVIHVQPLRGWKLKYDFCLTKRH